jgi:outer membrane protein TolC
MTTATSIFGRSADPSSVPTNSTFRLWHGASRFILLSATALTLAGCATFSPDGGMSVVGAVAATDLKADVVKVSDEAGALALAPRIQTLLRRPLNADSAVQIALLNNKGLQASFNELGVSEAQMVAASLPPNPRFSLARTTAPLSLEIERQIVGSIFALATLPARAAIAQDRFRGAQLKTAESVLRLAAETRRQYVRAVAANHQASYLQDAKTATEASAELFKRLGESGATNKLDQSREFAFYAELGAQLAQARLQQKIEREKLVRLLGVWGNDTGFKLPATLPPLPRLQTRREIESEAVKRRIDLQIARGDLELLAKSLGLTQATRFVNDIDLLGRSAIDKGKTVLPDGDIEREKRELKTFEVEIEIPLFDFGHSRVVAAEQTYMQAANKLAEKAVNVRSEAREAYIAYRGSYDIARLYQNQVLPLRKIIQQEALLQYNGMLIDVTELIADARARNLSNMAAIGARRDFWIAQTDLKHAVIGGGGGGGGVGGGGAAQVAAAEGGGTPH